MHITGKILITGGSAGIGLAYARRLAARGADLVLVGRDPSKLRGVADQLQSDSGRHVEALVADLEKPEDVRKVEERLRTDTALTGFINNAGAAAVTPLISSNVDQLTALLKVNVVAFTRLAAAAAIAFAARRSGLIINIASVVALAPDMLNGVYGGSKAYVLALTQSMAAELTPLGVTVQAVLPGATRTDLWARAGHGVENLPAEIVMDATEMVDAALAGLELGETVTIPSLPNVEDWQAFEKARTHLRPNLSRQHAADRYKIGTAAHG